MNAWNALKQNVDSDTSDGLISSVRGAIRRVLIAPYRAITFALFSSTLMGVRYKYFVLLSTICCLGFSALGVIVFIMDRSIADLTYVLGGFLALFFILVVTRKDNKHTRLLKEAEQYTAQQHDDFELN